MGNKTIIINGISYSGMPTFETVGTLYPTNNLALLQHLKSHNEYLLDTYMYSWLNKNELVHEYKDKSGNNFAVFERIEKQ